MALNIESGTVVCPAVDILLRLGSSCLTKPRVSQRAYYSYQILLYTGPSPSCLEWVIICSIPQAAVGEWLHLGHPGSQ
jgi:hypothetical protein